MVTKTRSFLNAAFAKQISQARYVQRSLPSQCAMDTQTLMKSASRYDTSRLVEDTSVSTTKPFKACKHPYSESGVLQTRFVTPSNGWRRIALLSRYVLVIYLLLFLPCAAAEVVFEPLGRVPVPLPPNLDQFVRDRNVALQLGKSLFWDAQVGSDNRTACASCHFHAGADSRSKNQVSPGLLAGDTTFQVARPNQTLQSVDFPFSRHPSEADNAPLIADANDVTSSQGVFRARFRNVRVNQADVCQHVPDDIFQIAHVNTRRVEPRNTPTTINAVFNFRNFWDGRARHVFNGVDPFGPRSPSPPLLKNVNGRIIQVSVELPNFSVASQAAGPPLSPFEMSCEGRTFVRLGRKLVRRSVRPLSGQQVARNDSVLGNLAAPGNTGGLTRTYGELIRSAFKPEWWTRGNALDANTEDLNITEEAVANPDAVRPDGSATARGRQNLIQPEAPNGGFSLLQANFSLFWGIAVGLYEASLVSDDTPLDRFLAGQTGALSAASQRGLSVFRNEGKCANCHGGAEFTNASFRRVANERIERMIMDDGSCGIYDNGFYNIGVRPTADDPGVGGTDPFGKPLSDSRSALAGGVPFISPPLGARPECDARVVVDGAFKTPGLRNVELSGPYFHNGGKATLKQVVDFYDRGGDFAAENRNNLDPDIEPLHLSEAQKSDLVAFLLSLTDERVRYERAPFDHPALCVPKGHNVDENRIENDGRGKGVDQLLCLQAIGRTGRAGPIGTFLNLDPQTR